MKRTMNGSWRIQIYSVSGRRINLKLNKATSKNDAAVFQSTARRLVQCRRLGTSFDPRDQQWIKERDSQTKKKLIRLEVIEPDSIKPDRPKPTIKSYGKEFLRRAKNRSPETFRKKQNTVDKLIDYFGPTTLLESVTAGDALQFWDWLIDDKPDGCGLAPKSTARRTIGYSREIWSRAIDDQLVNANPFRHPELKTAVKTNKKKHFYVSNELASRIYSVIRNPDDRLRFVLMRYAGYRSPSELNALKWDDVNWPEKEMTIQAPKTQHQDDEGVRTHPIFPEIRSDLELARQRADEHAVFVLPPVTHTTLTRHFLKWLAKIDHPRWPQLFTNLRRSAVTDEHDRQPAHIVGRWFGHCEKISRDHYCMSTDSHKARAIERVSQLAHNH